MTGGESLKSEVLEVYLMKFDEKKGGRIGNYWYRIDDGEEKRCGERECGGVRGGRCDH